MKTVDYHVPVMLAEVLEYLQVFEGGIYVDCTLGDGGHSLALLAHGVRVIGIDYSEQSLERATKRVNDAGYGTNFTAVKGNFADIDSLVKQAGFDKVNGILYDLGYSSSHLEDNIGISFSQNQLLDMRLDKSLGVTAADLLNSLSEKDLTTLFWKYGEEKFARRIAQAVIKFRSLKKLESTKELVDLVVDTVSPGYEERSRLHPATKVFQALRIVVNGELDNLSKSLPRAAQLLSTLPGGRMIVISFHSLEDKIVKDFGNAVRPTVIQLVKKPIRPSSREVEGNARARSARMRVFERVL